MSAITLSDVSKSFGRLRALDRLSFTVEFGAVTGFLGPNGAGKTTALRVLLGLVRPDSGAAVIDDRRYVELANPVREVGAVLEATSFHPGRTARTHLKVLATAAGLPASRADEVLAQVRLVEAADRRVGTFSLGMRQRLAVASAILGQPRVLILDEPANGLDPGAIRWLRLLLREQADQGHAVLVSSHVLTEIDQLADNVIIIAGGRLVRQGPLAEITDGSTLEDAFLELTADEELR
jgi:ABC-2 type transport system ATP-binding protein